MAGSPKDQSKSTAALKHELQLLEITILEDDFKKAAEADDADGYMFFLRNVLRYEDMDDDLHGRVCRQLAGPDAGHKHLLLLPRGHLKSSCVTIGLPMWRSIQNPNRTTAIFNETQDLPIEFMREIRDHWDFNPVLRQHWGHLVPKDKRVWKSDAVQLERDIISRTPTFMAKSIIESTAGRHPDCMILDDVVSDRTVNSPDGIQKTLSRFRELQALLEPPDPKKDPYKGTLIVIGTRWHFLDLYNFIMTKLGKYYEVMCRKALESGRVIFPQKFNKKILAELADTMGPWVFSAQMMNEPVDSENATFTPDMLRACRWEGSRSRFLESELTHVCMGIDPAFEGEDLFGMVVGCVDQVGHKRVLEGRVCSNKPESAINTAIGLIIKWKVQKVFFEAVGGQEWLRKHMVQELKKAGIHVSVVPISHQNKNKSIRIMGLAPEIQYGKLFIHESQENVVEQLLQFPRGHDDLADALEIFSRHAAGPGLRRPRSNARTSPGTGEYEIAQLEQNVASATSGLPWDTGKVWIES